MDFEFQPASIGDLDRLVELRLEAMRDSLSALDRFDPARAAQRFKDSFDAKSTRLILTTGEFAGCVALRQTQNACFELQHFYIARRFRRRGLGSRVLRELIREAGVPPRTIRLEVLRRSDAIQFYARHGFRHAGEGAWDVYMVLDAKTAEPGR